LIFSRPVARRALILALLGQAITVVVVPSSARAATTSVFNPVADAAVYSGQPSANFGSDPTLVADQSPKTKAFLRFEIAGLTAVPTGARLRLWVTNASSNGPEVRPVTSSWDEHTVTYDTRATVGSAVADVGKVSAGRWLEYNVGKLVSGNGPVDVAVVGDSSDGTDFVSREGPAAQQPQLVVETGDGEPPPPPPPPPPPGDAFSFGLVGDTGYSSSSVAKFLQVRDAMNAASLQFVTHVGDIKNGTDPCTDSVYSTNRDRFNGFTHPLVYTPGDNEWRDCSNKVERLDHLRGVFFTDDRSLGDPPMTLVRQSAAFPENALWRQGPITFVTLHTVGSDNNAGQTSEFGPRNAANIAWLQHAFDVAAAENSAAVVIMSHANPGFPPDSTSRSTKPGFESYLKAVRSEVQAWGKPVIYVHGDTHTFRVDQPTVLGTTLPNFTRVEVFGPSDEHWVEVEYDPTTAGLFRIRSR
jgi:hypothetical protein